jgi:hypothetical protein
MQMNIPLTDAMIVAIDLDLTAAGSVSEREPTPA